MTHQYNFASGNQPSDSMPDVPEDFTSFLRKNRPRVPENLTARQPTDDGWSQRVQDVKRSGNPMTHFGMPDSYSGRGWSPMGTERTEFGGLGDSRTPMYGSSFWERATESNSVFNGATTTTASTANKNYDSSTLGFVGSNPGLESNLSRIWGSDRPVSDNRTRSSSGGSGVDFGAAAEGKDMYERAWNEWERPPPNSRRHASCPDVNPKKQGTADVVGNTKFADGDNAEELGPAFYHSGNRRDRGENNVNVQSSTSWQSRGNTSGKSGCSNSSKTYSDVMKEDRNSSRTSHETGQKKSQGKAKASSCSFAPSSAKIPSHYQQSVTPPPGFESSTLHVPAGPDTGCGLDEFIGTSAKVQRWLQQSQSESPAEVDAQDIDSKRKRSKKKKKSKRPDPLSGSVASFIRDWNSGTSESTDPSSLDDLTKISSAYSTRRGEHRNKEHVMTQPGDICNNHNETNSNVQDIPVAKEEKAFFDPKRIFQETPSKPEKKKVENAASSSGTASTQNFFDPKRIFQSRTVGSKDDQKSRKESNIQLDKASGTVSPPSDYNLYQSKVQDECDFARNSVPFEQTESNHVNRGRYSNPVEEVGTDTTTTTTTTTSSPSSSPSHTGRGLWRDHLSGLGDNNNKEPIKNKGSYPVSDTSSTAGVQSMKHGIVKGHQSSGGARPDSSPAKRQDAHSKSPESFAHKDFTRHKVKTEEEDMRTRSQSRREAEQAAYSKQHQPHFVPGDGIRVSGPKVSTHQHNSSTSKPSRHHKTYSNDASESDPKDYPSAPDTEKLKKNYKSPPQPSSSTSSSKHPGRSQHTESEPGWKKNKTSRNQRHESRAGRHAKEKRDGHHHHHSYRSESPSAGEQCNGSTRTHPQKERRERSGRRRQDSEVTKGSDTAAHYYDGDQIYQWMKAIVRGFTWIVGFIIFLFLVLTAYVFSTCKVWIEYIIHILTEIWKSVAEILGINNPDRSSRWWGSWLGWFKRSKAGPHGNSHQGSDRCEHKNGRGKQAEFVELPATSSDAITRIMACDPEDAYAVLGVGDNASDDDIKKYYRKQCVMVHPDKCNLRHANDAFQMLQKSYETLTDPIQRYDLDRQRASAGETEDMLNDIYEKMKEAMNTLNCNMCENKHKRYPVDRSGYAARYCRQHDSYHGAMEGDMWAETTHLGFKWHYYACMDDAVFDITEWAKCQNLRHMEANACEVRYRIGSNRRRHPGHQFRPADETPPWQQFQPGFEEFRNGDEELDELLRHLFGDRASRTANDPRSSGQNSNRPTSGRKRRHRKKKY